MKLLSLSLSLSLGYTPFRNLSFLQYFQIFFFFFTLFPNQSTIFFLFNQTFLPSFLSFLSSLKFSNLSFSWPLPNLPFSFDALTYFLSYSFLPFFLSSIIKLFPSFLPFFLSSTQFSHLPFPFDLLNFLLPPLAKPGECRILWHSRGMVPQLGQIQRSSRVCENDPLEPETTWVEPKHNEGDEVRK